SNQLRSRGNDVSVEQSQPQQKDFSDTAWAVPARSALAGPGQWSAAARRQGTGMASGKRDDGRSRGTGKGKVGGGGPPRGRSRRRGEAEATQAEGQGGPAAARRTGKVAGPVAGG